MAHLQKIYEKYNRPDFHILATTYDSFSLMRRFLFHHPQGVMANYPIAVENKENWGVRGVPQAYIVGRDGKVVWGGHPNSNFDAEIEDALAGKDPEMPDVNKKYLKVLDDLYAEKYIKVIRSAKKAAEKEQAAFSDYLTFKVRKYYERYKGIVDAHIESGDIYLAVTLLGELVKKFKSTEYEASLKGMLKQLKSSKEYKTAYKEFKKLHEIADASRTGRPSGIQDAIKQVNSFLKKREENAATAYAKELLEILKKPWSAAEAARR